MKTPPKNPRVLMVTPEITYLPNGMGNVANYLSAKAGGLADVSAALISALFEQGADVHVAIPDYREMFRAKAAPVLGSQLNAIREKMPEDRIHLAEDRAFFYMNNVYSNYTTENLKIGLAFQREVINNIVPRVRPDLIHCNDWMTGLLPGMARQMCVPALFTIHNIHTVKAPLAQIEDRGIDAAYFWQNLYYQYVPVEYEDARESNPVDFLVSGVFAAHFVNTVSPTFLKEIVEGRHPFVTPPLREELANKWYSGVTSGILNAPDPSFDPVTDMNLIRQYGPEDHVEGKRENKALLQRNLGLVQDPDAPVFFWPHRLDPVQKGCQILADILYAMVSKYWQDKLQIVFVANGEFQRHFLEIVRLHQLQKRVAVCNFDEGLARLAYGGSDFMLMPSSFEPCGLPQMIAPIYGSLPVAHDTGGIHDTITMMDVPRDRGNGFLFNVHDANGLAWAMDQAMAFYRLSRQVKQAQIERVMGESRSTFNHATTARRYMELYEKMLDRPLICSAF